MVYPVKEHFLLIRGNGEGFIDFSRMKANGDILIKLQEKENIFSCRFAKWQISDEEE